MQIDRGLLQFPRLYGCTDLDNLSRASSRAVCTQLSRRDGHVFDYPDYRNRRQRLVRRR
jgi:hypothetical protein